MLSIPETQLGAVALPGPVALSCTKILPDSAMFSGSEVLPSPVVLPGPELLHDAAVLLGFVTFSGSIMSSGLIVWQSGVVFTMGASHPGDLDNVGSSGSNVGQ